MAQDKEKELQQCRNRFRDLAERAYTQNVFTFTDFLGLGEQDIFWQEEQKLKYAGYTLYGGTENTDRLMIRFGSEKELGYEVPFPIVCVNIRPVLQKFADDLSHRDFLGALMNLGIERSTLGDIKIAQNQAYLFCTDTIAPFICETLTQVRHTNVRCEIAASIPEIEQEKPQVITVQVQSLRVDAVLAKVCNLSREKSIDLFRAGKVYVNGRLCENNSRLLKQGEVVNARGFGKFFVSAEPRETKKGKLSLEVGVFR